MRDRLVELLYRHKLGFIKAEDLADFLLAEGVIVPPYKPMPLIDEGDRVLCPICETDLMGYYIGHDNEPTVITCFECGAWIDSTKAVTQEEAEKALAEREKKMSTLKKAVATYGKDMQLAVAIEELSELIKEICKSIRGSDNVERITEEMADCYIMMDQLAIIFGIKNCDINVFIDEKLARLEKRMEEREMNEEK